MKSNTSTMDNSNNLHTSSSKTLVRVMILIAIMFVGIINAEDKSHVEKKANTGRETEILLWVKSTENIDDVTKQVERSLELSKVGTTPDKYKSITLLLAKAEYLRSNNMSGGNEIADAAQQQLKNIADTTTPSGALKYAVLLSDIYKVKDQNAKAIETLEQCLQSYYPDIIKHPSIRLQAIPEPARISLEKLGILYKNEADTALDIADKKKWFSLAAGCFVSSACGYYDENKRKPETLPNQLLTQISACRDAIHILGGDLKLPTFLREKLPDANIGLINQMISQQNYKTALKLIEKSKSSLRMDCYHLECLAALNMKDQAINFADTCISKHKGNSEFVKAVLKSASILEKVNESEASLKLYQAFAALVPDDPQAPKVLVKYADYLKEHGQTDKAVKLYIETARQYIKDLNIASLCYMNAAQLQATSKKYSESIQVVEELERLNTSDNQS